MKFKFKILFVLILAMILFLPSMTVMAQGETPPQPWWTWEDITPEKLIAVAASLLALFFDYFPGVSAWFDPLEAGTKRLITLGLSVLVAVVVFVGQCYGILLTNYTCTPKDALSLLYGIVLAVVINYGVHRATRPTDTQRALMGLPSG